MYTCLRAYLLANTCSLTCHSPTTRQALAAIFFEPEQLAHEEQLLGTRAERAGGAAGDAAASDAGAAAVVLVVPELYRAKGLFEVAGSERMYALQAVQSTYELIEGPLWSDAAPRRQKWSGSTATQAAPPPPLQRPHPAHTPPARAWLPSWAERRPRAAWQPLLPLIGSRRGAAAALSLEALGPAPKSPIPSLDRPGRAAPLVRDLHRAQSAHARQPAHSAADVPRRGTTRCMRIATPYRTLLGDVHLHTQKRVYTTRNFDCIHNTQY